MTLIYTAAQYALRRERSREELVDAMQKILRESQRTTALIDDLLLLARGDAGRETASLEPIDAAPLLREAGEQATAMAAAKGIRVGVQLESEPLLVRANEAQLRRLLLILVDNALKYTPSGGRVTLAGRADAAEVRSVRRRHRLRDSPRKTCHTSSSASGGPTRCALARPAAPGSA